MTEFTQENFSKFVNDEYLRHVDNFTEYDDTIHKKIQEYYEHVNMCNGHVKYLLELDSITQLRREIIPEYIERYYYVITFKDIPFNDYDKKGLMQFSLNSDNFSVETLNKGDGYRECSLQSSICSNVIKRYFNSEKSNSVNVEHIIDY